METSICSSLSGRFPKISVITPSFNHGRFLRETIESITMQSYKDFEHIVVDGGSSDNTVDTLKEYPHIHWISEKETGENTILEAYRKGFCMSKGKYIIQCCVTDGFLDKDWFKKCAEVLDRDNEISLVWGLSQEMTGNGDMRKVVNVDFFDTPPPQKADFLPFWLAGGFGFPEGNFCVRREVYNICFPQRTDKDILSINPAWGFLYRFNTLGYLSYFLPVIANFGRTHENQRGIRLYEIEDPASRYYIACIEKYKNDLLHGKVKHYIRNGDSKIINEMGGNEIKRVKKMIRKYRLNSKLRRKIISLLRRLTVSSKPIFS